MDMLEEKLEGMGARTEQNSFLAWITNWGTCRTK